MAAVLELLAYCVVLVGALLGIAWVQSPTQRSHRRRRDARDRIALRRQIRGGGPIGGSS